MRLRQLGTSQTITLFAPPEVHQNIADLRNKKPDDHLSSYDVICWLLEQTCIGIEQLQALYHAQGVDFCRRTQAASDNPEFLEESNQRESYLKALRQTEQQSLEQLYGEGTKSKNTVPMSLPKTSSPQLISFMKHLDIRTKSLQNFGHAVEVSVLQEVEVEQERELTFEVETIRKVENPVHYSAYPFLGLHKDIVSFAKKGQLVPDSNSYKQAFEFLRGTALGQKHGISSDALFSNFYLSTEFTRTVKLPLECTYDSFQVSNVTGTRF
jgi:hypothetical protein